MISSPAPRSDLWLLLGAAALLLLALGFALGGEIAPPWSEGQRRVRALVRGSLGDAEVAALPTGIQQIWIPELDRVDRCVTCHQTIEAGPALAALAHPARSHPRPELLEQHPVERFGCTLCHGGQGWATEQQAAHGHVAHWEEPLLDARRARPYGLTAADLMEMRCNVCHRHDEVVEGMPLLNAAKAEVKKRRCDRCHVIDGRGATKGPDLSHEGDKHPTRYHLAASLLAPRSALRWHIAHFLDPKAITPGTDMPKFTLTEREAAGLALLVLSWRHTDLPRAWLPRPKDDRPSPAR